MEVWHYWGDQLLEVKTFLKNTDISIGDPKKATFGIPKEIKTDMDSVFNLAYFDKSGVVLHLPPEASGLIWSGQETYALDTLRHYSEKHRGKKYLDVELRHGDQAHIE
ncbi:MAG: hypothetical protein ACOCUH_03000, partial [Bacteriovoracia bacterium]